MKRNPPRRKSMRRPARLQSASHWIKTYTGKNIVRGYRKWFGVDMVCAIKELQLLGVKLDAAYVAQLLCNHAGAITARKKLKEKKCNDHEYDEDSDERFCFIAGYTSWGFPYGLTWEEQEALEECESKEDS